MVSLVYGVCYEVQMHRLQQQKALSQQLQSRFGKLPMNGVNMIQGLSTKFVSHLKLALRLGSELNIPIDGEFLGSAFLLS